MRNACGLSTIVSIEAGPNTTEKTQIEKILIRHEYSSMLESFSHLSLLLHRFLPHMPLLLLSLEITY